VWFHFSDLVEGRLSAADYLDLASRFTTWVLLGTPVLRCASEAARQRFVALVDVLCDQDRRLVLAGAPAPERIFEGVVDLPDLPRVMSRLELLPVVRDR
jgi:cell division protein ZapE